MNESPRRSSKSLETIMKPMVFIALFGALAAPRPAQAKVRVVTSIETFADLARRVGGDRVEVASLSRGSMDPHFVEAKPSLQVMLNRADLLVHVGLELEIGWLPPLVVSCRNPKIQPGGPGNLDASAAIPVLDVPATKVDRSMGDIHPSGNPHYWLVPDNAERVAKEIADRLKQLDPAGGATYDKNFNDFHTELARRKAGWEAQAASLKGVPVVTYHKSWSYLSSWLGLVEIGYVEPKPGIPPPLSHVGELVQRMRARKARLVIMESFYSRSTAQQVAQLAGGKLAVLPSDVGARDDAKDYFSLVDAVVKQLVELSK
jgi:zinc/manganese transport system substrate-binding protein